jgi:predicted  nucleic acid-binding Zn-ribbon protein
MLPAVDDRALLDLLDLQAEDTAIDRLNHRRSTLPEAVKLSELSALAAELEADSEIAEKQLAEVAREQSRLEGEIELLDEKIGREEQRMFSGAVANPKELSSLQAEVEMLKRKRGELEDGLLEVMVQKDQNAETATRLRSERADADAKATALRATVATLMAEIDAALAEHQGAREKKAIAIPEDLQKLYDGIRAAKGGVGAARLEAGTCQGCHTKLPAKEVERLRAEGGLQRCDNCRRILVVI